MFFCTPDAVVVERAFSTGIEKRIIPKLWAGHFVRMDDERLPKQISTKG